MSEPQGLCEKCRDLSFETLGASNGYLHSASYREFIAGAQTCALCRLIASDHRGVLPDVESVNPSGELVTFSLTSNLTGEQNARMVVHVSTGNGGAWYIHLDVFTMQHDPAAEIGVSEMIPLSNTSSDSSIEFAQKWLSLCHGSHGCADSMYTLKAQYTNGSWPARLLDVMAFAADSSDDIRLVEMHDASQPYAALSYCWGTNAALHSSYITTSSSLERGYKSIGLTALPRTLQDAVTITRSLGIRYLWIDALCIIQDSEKDWQTEAYKMGIIYSQAVVTIAADAGTGCDSGCFNTQSESDMKFPSDAVRVTSISSDKRATSLWFHKKRLDANFSFTYGDNIDSAPLQSRGWTLQERMFSPRILHFGAKMLYWECRQRLAAEDYHRMRFDKDTTTSGLLTTILETKDYLRTPIRQIITRWYTSIVENYSRRSLTYQKDKFPAILAVAKLVQEQTGSEYLAGLWRLNLQYGLFWKCVGPAARSPEYIAPTFSWASVANAVKWNEDVQADMVEAEFEVEDFHVEAAGNDPFGRIRSSWLRLSGHVLAAKVRPREMPFDEFKQLAYRRGLREEDVVLPNAVIVADDDEVCGHAYMDTPCSADEEVFCLLLRHPQSDSDKLQVLLLRRSKTSKYEYCRSGVGSFEDFPGDWESRFKSTARTSITIM